MSTEFTVSVKSSAGDYTSLNAAVAGLANDLTAATILVFSISSATNPTIAAGDSVVGLTSAATGTCVLVNAANTQILIKAIVGTFQSGETVKKTTDVTKEVVLSNAGDSPIVGIQCFSFQDTTAVGPVTYTTDASHYLRIYAASGSEATIPYTTTRYRLEVGVAALSITPKFYRIENISIKFTSNAVVAIKQAIKSGSGSGGDQRITGCYVKGVMNGTNTSACYGIVSTVAESLKVVNCVVDGFTDTGSTSNTGVTCSAGSITCYNVLVINSAKGFNRAGTTLKCVNCFYDGGSSGNQVAFTSTTAGSDYNASNTGTASGNAHDRVSQTFTYINSGTGDYHLASADAGAKGFGTDLSADATYPFSVDIDRLTRVVPWDIGPTKAPVTASTATAAGAATATLTALRWRNPTIGSATGVSSVSTTALRWRNVVLTAPAGVASVTVNATRWRNPVRGAIAGIASVTLSALRWRNPVLGTGAGVATVTASLNRWRNVSTTTAASSTVVANISALRQFAALMASGLASVTALITAIVAAVTATYSGKYAPEHASAVTDLSGATGFAVEHASALNDLGLAGR